ncbi:MAG TPA: hypothetical protein DDX71_01790 [Ruminococcus sp.]|nr:hypothetical protein [Ruminococcus sp.]
MLASERSKRRIYRLLSFVIPTAVLMVCFFVYQFVPFGNELSPLIGDAGAEYYPNLLLLRRILKNGESLLYTWRSGFGVAVVPDVIINFCTSPLNLLGMLLPDAMYETYIELMTCVRLGLAGYCFALLLQSIEKKPDGSVVAFATAYAVNMWMLTSFWQITMMGTVIVTPLVLLGLLRLVRNRDMVLYPLMLAFSLMMSSYMSLFTAVITGLFWIGLLISRRTPWKEVPKEFFKFIGLSVLSACIAAVVLMPTVLSMGATSNFTETSFASLDFTEFYASWQEMIAQLSTCVYPALNAHPANICSSMLAVLLIPAYMTTKRIPLGERIFGLFAAGFIWVSLWYAPLNFVWHGLRFPRVTVDRFAYLLPMVLCYMGWRFLTSVPNSAEQEMEKPTVGGVLLHYGQLILMGAGAAGVIWCVWSSGRSDVFFIPAAAAALLLILVGLIRFIPKKRSILTVLLVMTVTAEVFVNSWLSFNDTTLFAVGALGAVRTTHEADAAAVRADAGSSLFYRTGIVRDVACGDVELLYDLPGGTSLFSSMISADLLTLCDLLSLEGGTNYYGFGDLLPLNALLLDESYYIMDTHEKRTQIPYEKLGDSDVLKFPYPCSLGYCVPETPSLDELLPMSKTAIQNTIAKKMTGLADPVYADTDAEIVLGETNYASASLTDADTLTIKAETADDPTSLRSKADVQITVPADGNYVLDLQNDMELIKCLGRLKIMIGEEEFFDQDNLARALLGNRSAGFTERQLFSLGELKKDTVITLRYFVLEDWSGSAKIALKQFDADALAKVAAHLHENAMTLTEFGQDHFTASVNAKTDSLLYISMPYREGWTAYVDGQQTAIEPALGAMTGVRVPAGAHTVRLVYQQNGLFLGAVISGGALALYLILVIVQIILAVYRKKHPKAEASAYVPQHG